MICPKCYQESDDDSMFCKHCGTQLMGPVKNDVDWRGALILTWAIIFFVTGAVTTCIAQFVDQWYFNSWRYLYYSMCIISNMAAILPAIAVKSLWLKIITIMFVVIPAFYYMIMNIVGMFTEV